MTTLRQDSKWRKLKNFSKIYAKILEEENEREAAAAAAAVERRGKPCVTLQADGCLSTDTGTAILAKESGCVTLKQKQKWKGGGGIDMLTSV